MIHLQVVRCLNPGSELDELAMSSIAQWQTRCSLDFGRGLDGGGLGAQWHELEHDTGLHGVSAAKSEC